MSRAWPIVVVFVGGLAFGLGGSRLVDDLATERARDARADLERAVAHGLARHRNRQLELAQTAVALGRSELTVKLGLVADHAAALSQIEAELYKAVPGPADDPALTRLRAARAETITTAVDTFASDYAARLQRMGRADDTGVLDAEGRRFVTRCVAIGVSHCVYRAADDALVTFAAAERKAPGLGPDVLLVVDDNGIGRADVDRPAWSAVSGVTRTLPVLAEALATRAVVRDVGPIPGHDGLFLMVAVPLIEGPSVRGAALVAVDLGGHRLLADAEATGCDVSWGLVGTLGVAASTLSAGDAAELDGDRFFTARAAVPGNASATPIFVASVVKDLVYAPYADAQRTLWLFTGGGVVLLAAALVLGRARRRELKKS